jgi:UDP-glucose-4-epimerase GalE
MRLLLTGGAGYIGSACLRWLLRHGHDPIAYDNLSEGNPPAVPDGRLVEGDILDTARLARALREHRADGLMHFSALTSVPGSVTDPEGYYRVNVVGTKSVLDAMRDAGVSRIVFSSTAATYAFDTPMPLREDSPQLPESPYGTTKLAAERMIRDYAQAYGLGFTILRYFNAAGADPDGNFGEDHKKETHLVPLTLQVALGQREKLLVYGDDWGTRDGTCVRDYVHTEDLAQAHQRAVEAIEPGVARVYNLGSGTGTTVREVIEVCQAVSGRPVPHEIVGRRPGDPPVLVASPERITRELGWSPAFPDIRAIAESAWRWHSTHPNGYATQ